MSLVADNCCNCSAGETFSARQASSIKAWPHYLPWARWALGTDHAEGTAPTLDEYGQPVGYVAPDPSGPTVNPGSSKDYNEQTRYCTATLVATQHCLTVIDETGKQYLQPVSFTIQNWYDVRDGALVGCTVTFTPSPVPENYMIWCAGMSSGQWILNDDGTTSITGDFDFETYPKPDPELRLGGGTSVCGYILNWRYELTATKWSAEYDFWYQISNDGDIVFFTDTYELTYSAAYTAETVMWNAADMLGTVNWAEVAPNAGVLVTYLRDETGIRLHYEPSNWGAEYDACMTLAYGFWYARCSRVIDPQHELCDVYAVGHELMEPSLDETPYTGHEMQASGKQGTLYDALPGGTYTFDWTRIEQACGDPYGYAQWQACSLSRGMTASGKAKTTDEDLATSDG